MQRRHFLAFSGSLVIVCAIVACAAPQRPDGGHGLLPVGSPAPTISGKDQDGATVQLKQENKNAVLVYFYPKDATPGCTKEACAFRDTWDKFQAAGVQVLGVSNDSVESHKQFAEEHRLPFKLIADEDGTWARAFGVGGTAGFYPRVSFLIDKNGRVARVYEDVDPGVHANQVLSDAKQL